MANISTFGWGAPLVEQRSFGLSASSDGQDVADTTGGSAGYETTGGGDAGGGGSSGGGAPTTSGDPAVQQARCQALGLGNWDAKAGKCVTVAEKNRKWWWIGGGLVALGIVGGGYYAATHGY